MSRLCNYLIAAASMLGFTSAAYSQSVDYGQLEKIFGEPVTKSANGKLQRASDVPVAMDIITAEDIRRSGAETIPGLLKSVVGIDFLEATGEQQSIALRGYAQTFDSRILLLINGRAVFQSLFGDIAWEQLPVSMAEIRQIEVIRGPMSALFGFNAISGAINIVTYDPLHDTKVVGKVMVGDNGDTNVEGFLSSPINDNMGVRLSARSRRLDRQVVSTPPSSPPVTQRRANDSVGMIGEFSFRPSSRASLGLESTYSKGEIEDSLGNTDPATAAPNRAQNETVTWSMRGHGTLDFTLGQMFGAATFNKSTLRAAQLLDNAVSGPTSLDEELFVVEGGLLVTSLDNTTLRFIGEYRDNTFNQELGIPQLNSRSRIAFRTYASGALVDWQPVEEFTATLSARYSYRDSSTRQVLGPANPLAVGASTKTYGALSANAALIYRSDPLTSWRLAFARGSRVPSAAEVELTTPGFTEPELQSTTVDQAEIGIDRKIDAIQGSARANVYYAVNRDLASIFQSLGAPILFSSNIGDSKSWGAEIEANGKLVAGLSWSANYAFTDISDNLSNPTAAAISLFSTNYEKQTPRHMVNVGLNYDFGQFETSLSARYVSSRLAATGVLLSGQYLFSRVSPQFTMDARAAYAVTPRLTLELKAQGLTKKNQYLLGPSYAPSERRVWGGFRYEF
jgi:outer membrane receptor for ferrienterochelin and colicins